MAIVGHRPVKRASPDQLSDAAPSTISAIPSAMRRSVLLEREPGKQRREHTFRVQQKRGARCCHSAQSYINNTGPDAA